MKGHKVIIFTVSSRLETTFQNKMDAYAMETVMMEIDIIIQEQTKIANYTVWLEDRRLRLMNYVQKTNCLKISESGRKTLIKNITNMEIKVLGKSMLKRRHLRKK